MLMNLDARHQRWLRVLEMEWSQGCLCEACQALSAGDDKKLRAIFLEELRLREAARANPAQLELLPAKNDRRKTLDA